MAHLDQLPVELLLEIESHTSRATLNALTKTCKRFHAVFNVSLYKRDPDWVFWQAMERRNPDTIKKVIEVCPAKVSWDTGNFTPMTLAAYKSSAEIVRVLLDNGYSATTLDKNGYTPLSWAAWLNDADVMRALLGAGLDPNQKDIYGRTPLSIAAEAGHEDVVPVLLEYKADLSIWDDDHDSVEKDALRRDYVLVPYFLMNHRMVCGGILPRTAMGWAVMKRYEKIVKMLGGDLSSTKIGEVWVDEMFANPACGNPFIWHFQK
ncbi:ankyrin repeat-containing domain protein [Aspergillus avenaceus]|uniref:Ankyrin repeat-containing domain protein n=1 Tax=Aspergillus avenaceus TaxID=36643 RepID=A0A5N6TTS8_ASPAV|nr:ankyrin repeat-containing domain protein [Aspergillus avenaceus]